MKLTCVTAVFNAIKSGNRENLIRCVRSVAALNTEHEHLIYDGASTDGTVELLRELEGCCTMPHLRVVTEPDTGIYNALNKGVRDARGEWFYVLGCDDAIVRPEVMDRLIATTPQRIDAVASPVFYGDRDHIYAPSRSNILFGSSYPHQGMIVRTNQIRALNGFDEGYRIAADFDQEIRAVLADVKLIFATEAFTEFSSGGISCSEKEQRSVSCECADILGKNLRLDPGVATNLVTNRRLGLLDNLRLLTYPREIRYAATHLLLRSILRWMGLTKPNGALRWH